MALKPSKRKSFTSSLILFLTALLFFNIQYLRLLHYKLQNELTHPNAPQKYPNWFEVVARELGDETINIALVNMDETMMVDNVKVQSKGKIVKVDFRKVDDNTTKWSDLYPEWIDERSAKCPTLPMPVFENYKQLDVVVARVPNSSECEGRDVFRLQVNLVVANLLVRCGRSSKGKYSNRPIFAVFIGSCGPMWDIFRCDDLVLQVGDSWIYTPQLWRIKQKLLMPLGSCQLIPPLPLIGEPFHDRETKSSSSSFPAKKQTREAYATIIHTTENYVCGAIALAQSIIQSNSTKDLVLLADDRISPRSLDGLRAAGWKIKQIQRIRNPYSKKNSYNEWNYSKLRLWQLQEYDKVMFIDADFIVTKNLDEFFTYPQISAKGNDIHRFNSGLMLIEPSMCMYRTLMESRWLVKSYNGGDQGFLNEMFPWWHRLPNKINHLTFFFYATRNDTEGDHEGPGDNVYAVHYLGLKPWWCYRDYDCNWDRPENQRFASDSANKMWWDVYDKMPKELRQHCSLTSARDELIRKHRNKAKDAKLHDEHWKIQIKDPRQHAAAHSLH